LIGKKYSSMNRETRYFAKPHFEEKLSRKLNIKPFMSATVLDLSFFSPPPVDKCILS